MDGAAFKLLESAAHRTLHAHAFSRTSSQASLALTDLLSRYLTLLLTTSARYAQHAGRTDLTPSDALGALEDLGVNLEELSDYVSEGRELNRYAVYSGRRLEDLREFKAALADGLREDRDDAIPLVYAPIPEDVFINSDDENEDEPMEEEEESIPSHIEQLKFKLAEANADAMDVTTDAPLLPSPLSAPEPEPPSTRRQPTPPLPLSPISNPSSPSRKRPRTAAWRPPAHIPDFLPPFPSQPAADEAPERRSPSPIPDLPPRLSATGTSPSAKPDDRNGTEAQVSAPAALTQPSASTSAAVADYLTPVPYDQSTLSSTPHWHLPQPPRHLSTPSTTPIRPPHLQTPQTEPALIQAYHHILTHPPPKTITAVNPSRYRVALALLREAEVRPRWDPPDTLFGASAPNPPRVVAPPPSHAVPIVPANTPATPADAKGDGGREKVPLPSAPPRPVVYPEHIAPSISQQGSRLPELARQILPLAVHTRATKLSHPPPLWRGSEKLIYPPAVPAPWNGYAAELAKESKEKGKDKDKAKDATILKDAKMYATWPYEQRSYTDDLPAHRRTRAPTLQSTGAPSVTVPASRPRSMSKDLQS